VVSRHALQDHFGLQVVGLSGQARDVALCKSFLRGWERIRNVAARNRSAPSDNRVVLKSSDFQTS